MPTDEIPVRCFFALADSKIMPFEEAMGLAGHFGALVAHLNDPKRWHRGLENSVPFSLPAETLPCSKERLQTAFAVTIAGLVVELGIGPSPRMREFLSRPSALSSDGNRDVREQLKYTLHLCSWCSNDLAMFTRKPVFLPHGAETPEGVKVRWGSESVYLNWQEECGKRLDSIWAAWSASRIPTSQLGVALLCYWSATDDSLHALLSNSVLAAIRAT